MNMAIENREGSAGTIPPLAANSAVTEKRPRACYIYYQGFGQLIHREAMVLRREGFDVDIICLRMLATEKWYELFDGINLYRIQSRLHAEKNVAGYFLRLLLFLVKATLLVSWLALCRRYRVIHVTSPPDIVVFTTIIPKLLGSRIILDIHDIGPELFMRKLNVREDHPLITCLKFLERISARYADHVIIVTHMWQKRLLSRSVTPEKCTVLLNVPDQNLFRFAPRQRQGDTFNLYYHGSTEEHFGVDTLLDAMAIISRKIDNAVLHIYSQKRGRMFDMLREKVRQNGIEKSVFFHDGVPFHTLPGILADADIGIVPTKDSVFSDEAVSMKSLEYLFLGIPVVISRTTAHRYYYDESMVRFFTPCNSEDLAKAVIELHDDRRKREEMVRSSQEFIDRYGWDRTGGIYRDIVLGLTETGRQA